MMVDKLKRGNCIVDENGFVFFWFLERLGVKEAARKSLEVGWNFVEKTGEETQLHSC